MAYERASCAMGAQGLRVWSHLLVGNWLEGKVRMVVALATEGGPGLLPA